MMSTSITGGIVVVTLSVFAKKTRGIQEEDIPIVKEHLMPFDLLIPVDGKFIPLLLKDEDMYDWTD